MEANGSEPRRSLVVDHESLQQPQSDTRRKGGWITFPFLGGLFLCLQLSIDRAIEIYVCPSAAAVQMQGEEC